MAPPDSGVDAILSFISVEIDLVDVQLDTLENTVSGSIFNGLCPLESPRISS